MNAMERTGSETAQRGARQTKVGVVVSNKMDKTVVVRVDKTTVHGLYHRYVRRSSQFHAHDEGNRCGVGDRVEIVSTRPLSKTKRWRVREVLKKAAVDEMAIGDQP
jgi:small subunit ribosomal protein S17